MLSVFGHFQQISILTQKHQKENYALVLRSSIFHIVMHFYSINHLMTVVQKHKELKHFLLKYALGKASRDFIDIQITTWKFPNVIFSLVKKNKN